MSMELLGLLAIPLFFLVAGLYLWHVGRAMTGLPVEADELIPGHWDMNVVQNTAKQISEKPLDTLPYLPPATGRRYIIVGGAGFVGGWIVRHLVLRGEDPNNIRIIGRNPPSREELRSGPASHVGFVSADVRDLESLRKAFLASWPGDDQENATSGLTVFHAAASMQYHERHTSLLSRSSEINVDGTRNSLAAAQEAGASVFVLTSSASVSVRPINHWVWPWQRRPKNLVQVVRDEPGDLRTKASQFFSNYAYTKHLAEKVVHDADSQEKGFRTGCLRPGGGIYGTGGDINIEALLKRGVNPSWATPMTQSLTYVENASYGHLLYEQRLIEAQSVSQTNTIRNLGGQTYLIADEGPPISYGDIFRAMNALTDNRVRFPPVPPSAMLVLAHLVEFYYLLQARWLKFLPPVKEPLSQLQPSIFSVTSIHWKIDYSRARLSPAEGGLGYQPPWTTMQGVCQVVSNHLQAPSPKSAEVLEAVPIAPEIV